MFNLQPTPRRTPSSRNLEIYAQVKIRGCSQTQVAGEHKLTQSRVSRIIAQVEAWRGASPDAQDQLSVTQRCRHERWLAHERWEMIFQRSIEELAASHRTLTSERSGERDGKPFREVTKREQATSVQWMKTATKAAENLLKLAELEPLPNPPSYEQSAAQERYRIEQWLIKKRIEAEIDKKTATSSNVAELIDQLLAALLGEQPQFGMHHMANPGPAVQELVRRFVLPAATANQPRPAAEQLAAETVGAPPPTTAPATSAPQAPAGDNYHMCHTPAAAMTSADAADSATEVAATPCAAGTCVQPAAASSAAVIPSASSKNPADMTPDREPWEDEYERMVAQRKTIRLAGSIVVHP
jgi:hypothetical protein